MNGSPFMLQGDGPVLVIENRSTRVPAAPWPLDAVTDTWLVGQDSDPGVAVVLVGAGAVVGGAVVTGCDLVEVLEEGEPVVQPLSAMPNPASRAAPPVMTARR
jgi:hypothetical protein